jgi:hypothetical protein
MRALLWMVGIVFVLGCGEASCPPEYPVLRDGNCYRGDGGAEPARDAGARRDAPAAPEEDAGEVERDDGGGVICNGTHPLLDGERRYCEAGDCYCADPDSCFAQAVADACCAGAIVCGGETDAGTPVVCNPTHPLLDGDRRYCEAGDCYCADPDACFNEAVASACCEGEVACGP